MPAGADVELVLAAEFAPTDREQWDAAVAAALDRMGKLDPAEAVERLRSTSYDGITIEPLYTADDVPGDDAPGFPGSWPFARGRTPIGAGPHGWDVRQRVDARTGAGAAQTELELGATSILLDLQGLDAISRDAIDAVLEGVLLDVAGVVVDAGPRWREAADVVGDRLVSGSLGADPLGVAAGDPAAVAAEEHLDAIATWIERLGAKRPDLRVVTVDGTRFHDAGASDAQQLGTAIALGIAYLRELDIRGTAAADAIGRIELRLAATGDQFATIATVRAARVLWARVAEAVGAPGATSPVHAVTSRAMMTAYDPWVNALRSTVACFAAGIAGADAVTVLPHDLLRGDEATELGRRLGRNTQSILLHESHLAEVVDPAGGSWAVERLTEELAASAWAWMQEIEAAGGFRAAAASGLIAERIAATRAARERDIDTRRAPLTGLSEFPDISEPVPPPAPPPRSGPLGAHRWSERFEEQRRRVDAVAVDGRRPAVFLATIGTPATFNARVMFAQNVLAVAGVATVAGPVTDDAAVIADAFRDSGATVACLCSSDAAYAAHGVAAVTALVGAGARAVYVAGRPQAVLDGFAAAGAGRTIHAGVDVRATLTELLDLLQVP